MSRDEALDDFLARSADVLDDWQGSDDAMSVQGGSVGGSEYTSPVMTFYGGGGSGGSAESERVHAASAGDSFEIRDGFDGPVIAIGSGHNGWILGGGSGYSSAVSDLPEDRRIADDHVNRLSIAFDVPRELLPTDDLMFPEVRLRAQTEAFARAVDDTLLRQAAIDVAERVPDSVMQMRSKDHAVEQVLRAAVAAGWMPPRRSEDEVLSE